MAIKQYHWRFIGASKLENLSIRTSRLQLNYSSNSIEELKETLLQTPDQYPHEIKLEHFRRGDEKMQAYILNGIATHRDAAVDAVPETAMLDFGQCGCHQQNISYYSDYQKYGRHKGQGHLFVGTLPTTPICETAIALNLKASAYYLDSMGRFETLYSEIEMLLESTPSKRVLVYHYSGHVIYTFLAEYDGNGICIDEKESSFYSLFPHE